MKKNVIKQIKGKKILITGGTGSIGQELVKFLLKCSPKSIRLLTNDENSVFDAKVKFGDNAPITYFIGDVRDKDRINLAIRNVDIVFHAAAMKHVDLCEQNPFDAVKTNVIGTSNVIESCILENVSRFILISTDKAAEPTNTLGASKLLAEKLTIDATSYVGLGKTIFNVVRFGNVIGTRGSVFQIFKNQLKQNKPITVHDKEMTRFIMSPSQAASLILEIIPISKSGETFILKMPSVKIDLLAQTMIKVYNKKYRLNVKSKIKYTNSKPGEKIHEHLLGNGEISFCHDIGNMYKINSNVNKKKINKDEFYSETTKKMSANELEKLVDLLLEE
jgi:UDP-N-acetylglucosamine 4,6-dehydratase/5-epimerase